MPRFLSRMILAPPEEEERETISLGNCWSICTNLSARKA